MNGASCCLKCLSVTRTPKLDDSGNLTDIMVSIAKFGSGNSTSADNSMWPTPGSFVSLSTENDGLFQPGYQYNFSVTAVIHAQGDTNANSRKKT